MGRKSEPSTSAKPKTKQRSAGKKHKVRASTTDFLPLSTAQRRVWLLQELLPENPLFNSTLLLRLMGGLNRQALEGALNEVLRRHEALRASFTVSDGKPVQSISPSLDLSLPLVDLSKAPKAKRGTKALSLCEQEALKPFDLTNPPLLRASLLRLKGKEHILLITTHRIVFDDRSAQILIDELSALYRVLSRGEKTPLPELSAQYRDFVQWQSGWLEGKQADKRLSYWKDSLADMPVLELPTDRPRPAAYTYRGSTISFELPASLSKGVKALGRKEGASLFETLLSAFIALLYRYTGAEDIVVGASVTIRSRPEFEGLIGNFTNTAPIRAAVSGELSFKELLRSVKDSSKRALANGDFPFEKLIEELPFERDISRSPIVQAAFNFAERNVRSIKLPGIVTTLTSAHNGASELDLTLEMREGDAGLIGEIEYNSDLFDKGTMTRAAERFEILLEGIVKDPDERISELPMLTDWEFENLIIGLNDTTDAAYEDMCLHELFEAQVERTPENTALVFEDKRLTYSELNRRSNQLAHYLIKKGVRLEMSVGVCVERSMEMVIGFLGILKAGGVYVPINHESPKDRIEFILKDAGAGALITQSRLVDKVSETCENLICIDSDWKAISKQSPENPNVGIAPDNLAHIIYTSGSSGHPKGVMSPHRYLCIFANTAVKAFNIHSKSRVLQFASVSFVVSLTEMVLPLRMGGEVRLIPEELSLPGADLMRFLREEAITTLRITPSALEAMPYEELPDLQTIIVAGEICSQELAKLWSKGRRFVMSYGSTECSSIINDGIDGTGKPPLGKPIANAQVYLLDSNLQPVPIGAPGEIHISGYGLARGYLNSPDLTAEKFIPDPFGKQPGARMYNTGDLARHLPDGSIEILGRADRQVKIRGIRIELGEIESVLARHPNVSEAVVSVTGEKGSNKRLTAYVVPKQKTQRLTAELRHHISKKLPVYMIPSAFVILDSFPLTAHGKLDRKALPSPDTRRTDLKEDFVAPSTRLEKQLSELWERILDVRPVGVSDDFFELGGDSLQAVRIASEINRLLKKDFPLNLLLKVPTIEQLVSLINKADFSGPHSPLVEIQGGGSKRPFFCVHAVGGSIISYLELARSIDAEQPFYALEAPGLSGKGELHTVIEELAALYIEAIKDVQSEGPFLIGGYSFGAVAAYEMAQQLRSEGQKVELLAMIDPPDLNNYEHNPSDDDFTHLTRHEMEQLGNALGFQLDRLNYAMDLMEKLSREEQLAYIAEWEIKEPENSDPETLLTLRLLRVLQANFRALNDYQPKPYPGKVTLFNGSTKIAESPKDNTIGWGKLARGGIELYVIPGNHFTLLQYPQVQILAWRLKTCINRSGEINA
ncbi:MAG: amino acid adenylation domain-containing protein [Candidatus Dadabacteria bacterium]|nr:amino acid adenylation domain-containing protein [Candidatus Dadabacteria bacterium]